MRLWVSYLALVAVLSLPCRAQNRGKPHLMPFVATAYTQEGTTRSGLPAQPGTVAADPSVLPIGTRIKVSNAGPHSGIYTVTDSGATVKGRRIDIYVASRAGAKKFGRKMVQVTVLKWGDWEAKEE